MAAKMLTPLDVQCKIMPSVAPHLKCPLIQLEKIELLLDCLNPSIPRSVYETVLKFNDIPQFIEILKERKQARAKAGHDGIPKYGEMIQSMRTVSLNSLVSINSVLTTTNILNSNFTLKMTFIA